MLSPFLIKVRFLYNLDFPAIFIMLELIVTKGFKRKPITINCMNKAEGTHCSPKKTLINGHAEPIRKKLTAKWINEKWLKILKYISLRLLGLGSLAIME